MFKFVRYLLPPNNWKLPVLILSGLLLGSVIFLFYLSKANSYLSDNPKVCINCHIMGEQFVSWEHSSHRLVANCNDCHVPHNNIFSHYYFKAKDGLRHATIFTLRGEKQVIFIKEAGIEVVQENCERCHEKLVCSIEFMEQGGFGGNEEIEEQKGERLCWDCHRETPHGRMHSLSTSPNARVPIEQSKVPDWLKKLISK
jgi:cytochrome c nitrite reductase small subunit